MPSAKFRRLMERQGAHRAVLRRMHLRAQRHTCPYCLRPIADGEETLDHKLPKSRGGKDTAENTCACHYVCNVDKNDKTDDEYINLIVSRLLIFTRITM